MRERLVWARTNVAGRVTPPAFLSGRRRAAAVEIRDSLRVVDRTKWVRSESCPLPPGLVARYLRSAEENNRERARHVPTIEILRPTGNLGLWISYLPPTHSVRWIWWWFADSRRCPTASC